MYTPEKLRQRLTDFAEDAEAHPEDSDSVTAETRQTCLSYFRTHEDHLIRLSTLTTTPGGQIHARLAYPGDTIIHVYFLGKEIT